MGLNTTVVILNDRLHDIENDPDFGRKLSQAIQGFSPSKGPLDVVNGCKIISTTHADNIGIVLVGGNTGQWLGMLSMEVLRKTLSKWFPNLLKDLR